MQESYYRVGLRRLGLDTEYKGIEIVPLDKSYVRKNANGIRNALSRDAQIDIFDAG